MRAGSNVVALLLLAIGCLIAPTKALAATPASTTPIPPEVAARFKASESPLYVAGFVGTFVMTTRSVVQHPDGDDRKESEVRVAGTRGPNGKTASTLLDFRENGRDVTEERRERVEKGDAERDRRRAEAREARDGRDPVSLPVGDEAKRFRFGPPKPAGPLTSIAFEPRPEHADEEGMLKGTLAWDTASGAPAWSEIEVLNPPSGVSQMTMRMDYAEVAGRTMVVRLRTTGHAKLLFFKRVFDVEIRWDEIVPSR